MSMLTGYFILTVASAVASLYKTGAADEPLVPILKGTSAAASLMLLGSALESEWSFPTAFPFAAAAAAAMYALEKFVWNTCTFCCTSNVVSFVLLSLGAGKAYHALTQDRALAGRALTFFFGALAMSAWFRVNLLPRLAPHNPMAAFIADADALKSFTEAALVFFGTFGMISLA
jgi:hypothetical protein